MGTSLLRAQESHVRLQAGAQEVLFDFTVRDKHHKLLTDLDSGEVSIFENGVPQKITSFRFRNGSTSDGSALVKQVPGTIRSSYDPMRELNLITIVFASIGPNSRQRAVDFVNDFLTVELPQNTWIGVFALRPYLKVVQPYTGDVALLKKAVYEAVQGSPSDVTRESEQAPTQLQRALSATRLETFRPLSPGSAEDRGPMRSNNLFTGVEIQLATMTLKTLFDREGPRTLDGLRSLERQQAAIPGRKTVLLVSEGLLVPPDQTDPLKEITAEANRNNVTFYTLDARGLSTADLSAMGNLSSNALSGVGTGVVDVRREKDHIGASGPTVQHTDFQQNARELAQSTGGFSMENSNDLHAPLRRVMEDVRAHYELTYAPTSKDYNGSFRKIEIKISRPGVLVNGRSGYFALPLVMGAQIQPFEVAALRALQSQPLPHSIPFRAAAFRFGPAPDGFAHRIAVEIPIGSLQTSSNAAKSNFQLRVSVMALLKDEHGEIVAKAVRDLPYEAPVARVEDFRKGNLSMILPMDAAPGKYHLDLVVLDRIAEKTSVRRSFLMVPESSAFSASDLVWVRSVQATGESQDVTNPLETGEGRITPKIEGDFSASEAPRFLFRVYPGAAGISGMGAHLTLSRDHVEVVSTDLPTPKPEGTAPAYFQGQFRPALCRPVSTMFRLLCVRDNRLRGLAPMSR